MPSESAEPARVFPATSGRFAGWCGVIAVIGFSFALWTDGESSPADLRVTLGALGVLALIYAFMLRPKVVVRQEHLVLVNPYEDIIIPAGALTRLQVKVATFAYVGQKKYVGVAVGRKVRNMVRGRQEVGGGGFGMFGSRLDDYVRATGGQTVERTQVADLLQEWGDRTVQRGPTGDLPNGPVHRRPVWWLVALTILPWVALAVLLAVGG